MKVPQAIRIRQNEWNGNKCWRRDITFQHTTERVCVCVNSVRSMRSCACVSILSSTNFSVLLLNVNLTLSAPFALCLSHSFQLVEACSSPAMHSVISLRSYIVLFPFFSLSVSVFASLSLSRFIASARLPHIFIVDHICRTLSSHTHTYHDELHSFGFGSCTCDPNNRRRHSRPQPPSYAIKYIHNNHLSHICCSVRTNTIFLFPVRSLLCVVFALRTVESSFFKIASVTVSSSCCVEVNFTPKQSSFARSLRISNIYFCRCRSFSFWNFASFHWANREQLPF